MRPFSRHDSPPAYVATLLALGLAALPMSGADIGDLVEQRRDEAIAIASDLFDYAELGYQEVKSSARLATYLEEYGFAVTNGVAGMPTSFIATRGTASP